MLTDAQLGRLAEKYAFTTAQLNARQLAIVFGFSSTWTLKAIKVAGTQAGDSPFRGNYSTIADIRRWLRKHPNFVASHHLRRPDRAEPKAVAA